jgi:hypothetical protein
MKLFQAQIKKEQVNKHQRLLTSAHALLHLDIMFFLRILIHMGNVSISFEFGKNDIQAG